MKVIFLIAAAAAIILAVNSSNTPANAGKTEAEPACCGRKKCEKSQSKKDKDELFLFQPSPFHI